MKLRHLRHLFPGSAFLASNKRALGALRAAIEPLESRVLLSITTPPIAGSWTAALNENFDTIDPTIWTNSRFWWNGNGTDSGTYLPSQAAVSNGILSLTAINTPSVDSAGVTQPITSGMINTGGIQGLSTPGFAFTYGFIDIRMQCAPGSGIWSALWMAPVSHQDTNGELDVAENVSTKPTSSYIGFHYGGVNQTEQLSFNDQTGFHDYGLDWEPGSLTWYEDGTAVYTYKGANVPAQAEYAIVNLDCFNNTGWDGSTANALPSSTMQVDYLRVWQHTPNDTFGSQVKPAVNQFSDPSFENLSIGGLGTSTYVPSTFDWQYNGLSGLQTNNSAFGAANAPDGVQTAFIQDQPGQTPGSISQTLNVSSAGNYQITLDAAQRKGYGIEPISVTVDGTVVATITPGSTAWQSFATPTFSLTAGNHVFAFTGAAETASDSDSFLDLVKLVPAVTPTAPTGITAVTSYTGVSLNWTASNGASSYDIYRGTAAGGEAATPIATGVTATSFVDTGLLTGTTYYYYVTAVYSTLTPPNNQSAPSKEVSTVAGVVTPAPGIIQAENYNLGGEGVAYHDTDAANQGGVYRNDGVDIEATSDTGGGYNVGYVAAGEWMKYTVNVATTGTYTLGVRLATPTAGGAFHVESDGANITGSMTAPNTGGWQTWTTLTKTVSLTAGTHVLRLYIDSATSNGWFANINWLSLALNVADTQPPTAPANLSVTAQTATSVSLSWTASTDNVGVTGYTVYRGTTAVGTLGGTTTTYTDSSLTPGTTYSYTVVASDAAGNKSAASTGVSATTAAAPPPQFADGSFEAVNVGTTYAYDPTSANWTFANKAGVEVNGSAWNAAAAPDGKQAAFLQSNQGVGGSIKQSLSITTAGSYQISFSAAQRANYGTAPIAVAVDGTIVATITPSSNAFATYTTPVLTLAAGTHAFTFSTAVITTADTDSFIDKVSLASIAPTLFAAHFDFGPTGSPVAAGYTPFSTAAYSSSVGYGWLPGANLWALDRGALAGTSALTEDFIQTDSGGATFEINVPDGVYNVTPTLGDALYGHDLQGIYLQGTQVDTITTAKDQFVSNTYKITVTNGQIQFTFKDLGGVDLYTTLDALDIVQVS
jgi:beta-glucanase (GH16 family)/fibronectin type 3 domain-containing protein